MLNEEELLTNDIKIERNCKNVEDIDIYSDVLTDQDDIIHKLKQKVEALVDEKNLLTKSLDSVKKSYQQLQSNYQDLQTKYKTVSFNSSALFKTAQAEIARKNIIIQDLRKNYDNVVFHKKPTHSAEIQNQPASSSKIRSPPKEIESFKIEPSLPEDRSNSLKVLDRVKDPHIDVINKLVKQEAESKDLNKKGSQFIPNSANNAHNNTAPPVLGPITTFSKRLYKKLHGVSPQKKKQSSLFSPEKDTAIIQKTKMSGRRKSSYHELFGESPLKLDPNTTESLNKLRKASKSPINLVYSSSPILPSSPEELIIDTTACFQNTSCVSHCDKKDKEVLMKTQHLLKNDCVDLSLQANEQMDVQGFNSAPSDIKKLHSPSKPKQNQEKQSILSNETIGKMSTNLNSGGSNKLVENESKDIPCISANRDKESPCLPDLSECFSLDNEYQAPNKMHSSTRRNISVFSNKSMTVQEQIDNNLPKVIPMSVVNRNTDTCANHANKDQVVNSKINIGKTIQIVPRFIPSPPQLTLVSAFKHSENSVFNITEDTVGFVSALTRVRDISPIKTPDKSGMISNNTDQNSSSSTENHIGVQPDTLKPPSSISKNLIQISEDITRRELTRESKHNSNIGNEKPERNVTKITGKTNEFRKKPNEDNLSSKKPELISFNMTKCVSSFESNHNTSDDSMAMKMSQKSASLNKSSSESVILQKPLLKRTTESKNVNVELLHNNTTHSKTAIKDGELLEAREKTILNKDCSIREIDSSVNKLVHSLSSSHTDQRLFKRSESLKMMPKPIPKVDYDTLSNQKNFEKNIEIDPFEKEIIPSNELSQIPHIASINRKIRVSKCQGNSGMVKPSTTLEVKRPDNLLKKSVNKVNRQILNNRRNINNSSNRLERKSDSNVRSKSNHNTKNNQNTNPAIKNHNSCKRESESPELRNMRKTTHISRRDRDPSFSHNNKSTRYNKSLSKSPDARNTSNCSSHLERSPHSSKFFSRTRSSHIPRRSESSSPDIHNKNKPYNPSKRLQRESKSVSPRRRSRSKRWRNRSISPIVNKLNKSGNRPSCFDHNTNPRSMRHNYYKKSRSRSPYGSRKRNRSRSLDNNPEQLNRSSSDKKYEINREMDNKRHMIPNEDDTVKKEQFYKGELERLRKELELVKSKSKKSDLGETENSLEANNLTLMLDKPMPVKGALQSSTLSLVPASQKDTLPDVENNPILKVTKDKHSTINSIYGDNVLHQDCFQVKEISQSFISKPVFIKDLPQDFSTPFKIIKLKRRRRNLGDSDGNVVSASPNINIGTQSTSLNIQKNSQQQF